MTASGCQPSSRPRHVPPGGPQLHLPLDDRQQRRRRFDVAAEGGAGKQQRGDRLAVECPVDCRRLGEPAVDEPGKLRAAAGVEIRSRRELPRRGDRVAQPWRARRPRKPFIEAGVCQRVGTPQRPGEAGVAAGVGPVGVRLGDRRVARGFVGLRSRSHGLSPEAVVCRPSGALWRCGHDPTGFRPRLSSVAPLGLCGAAVTIPRAFARGCRLSPLRGFVVLRSRSHGLSPEAVVCRPSGAL